MLILSGGNVVGNSDKTNTRVVNNRFSGFGAAASPTIKQISTEAQKLTRQSGQAIQKAKKTTQVLSTTSSQLKQQISSLRGSSLGRLSGYGAVSVAELKAQLKAKEANITKTKQVIQVAKQAVASTMKK